MRLLLCFWKQMGARLKSPKDSDNDPVARHDNNEQTNHLLKQLIHQLKELVISQAVLDASLKNLTASVDAAVAALAAGSTDTSTPDTVVTSFVSGVDAQTVRLAAATPPPPPPPPTP